MINKTYKRKYNSTQSKIEATAKIEILLKFILLLIGVTRIAVHKNET